MARLLDQTVAATRRISADLRPLMLDDLGLADAAGWLVDDFAKRTGITARIDLGDVEALAGLPPAMANALYRAVQESLTNVARHAQAKHAWVVFRADGAEIRVEVEDDGRGIAADALPRVFEPTFSTTSSGAGLGLAIARRLVEGWGGTITLDSTPGRGTRVTLTLRT